MSEINLAKSEIEDYFIINNLQIGYKSLFVLNIIPILRNGLG